MGESPGATGKRRTLLRLAIVLPVHLEWRRLWGGRRDRDYLGPSDGPSRVDSLRMHRLRAQRQQENWRGPNLATAGGGGVKDRSEFSLWLGRAWRFS
jgi:hypothetical protein